MGTETRLGSCFKQRYFLREYRSRGSGYAMQTLCP